MNELKELIEKIEKLDEVTLNNPGRGGVFIYDRYGSQVDEISVFELQSLAAELTLAHKKLEILQASNDHYADENNWDVAILEAGGVYENALYIRNNTGPDFARKAQEEIARLEGSNG